MKKHEKEILSKACFEKIKNTRAISLDSLDESIGVEETNAVTSTFFVTLLDEDFRKNEEKLAKLKEDIITNCALQEKDFTFSFSFEPYNDNKLVLSVYAISSDVRKCEDIISKIEVMLKCKSINFNRDSSFLLWRENEVHICVKVNKNCMLKNDI